MAWGPWKQTKLITKVPSRLENHETSINSNVNSGLSYLLVLEERLLITIFSSRCYRSIFKYETGFVWMCILIVSNSRRITIKTGIYYMLVAKLFRFASKDLEHVKTPFANRLGKCPGEPLFFHKLLHFLKKLYLFFFWPYELYEAMYCGESDHISLSVL